MNYLPIKQYLHGGCVFYTLTAITVRSLLELWLKWELSNTEQSEAETQADLDGRHNRDKFAANILSGVGVTAGKTKLKYPYLPCSLTVDFLILPEDIQKNYLCRRTSIREDSCPLLQLIWLISLHHPFFFFSPPLRERREWSHYSNHIALLSYLWNRKISMKKSKSEILLLIPDLCLKHFSV